MYPADARMHSMARRSYDERRGFPRAQLCHLDLGLGVGNWVVSTEIVAPRAGVCTESKAAHEKASATQSLSAPAPSSGHRSRISGIDGPKRRWSDTLLAGDGGVASPPRGHKHGGCRNEKPIEN